MLSPKGPPALGRQISWGHGGVGGVAGTGLAKYQRGAFQAQRVCGIRALHCREAVLQCTRDHRRRRPATERCPGVLEPQRA